MEKTKIEILRADESLKEIGDHYAFRHRMANSEAEGVYVVAIDEGGHNQYFQCVDRNGDPIEHRSHKFSTDMQEQIDVFFECDLDRELSDYTSASVEEIRAWIKTRTPEQLERIKECLHDDYIGSEHIAEGFNRSLCWVLGGLYEKEKEETASE